MGKMSIIWSVLIGLGLLLSGCAGNTPVGIGVASLHGCDSLVSTANLMTAIKPRLSAADQVLGGKWLTSAAVLCQTKTPPAGTTAVVNGLLSDVQSLATQLSTPAVTAVTASTKS